MGYDSRSFGTPRVPSDSGYEEPPVIDDSLAFRLPAINQLCGRLVKPDVEAWSPNSFQTPFLPGVVPKDFANAVLRDRTQRRFDGHLGRYDFTVSPQMVNGQVWRGFIPRPQAGYQRRENCPEYEILCWQWDSDGPNTGYVKPEYIARLRKRLDALDAIVRSYSRMENTYTNYWTIRPVRPLKSEIDSLARITTWEEAVDVGVEVQRNLKDKAAWTEFARRLVARSWSDSITAVRENGIPAANDDLLGAWINGNREQDSLWLLSQGVPCFIAHRLDPLDRWTTGIASDIRDSWTSGTDVRVLSETVNPYDHVAIRNGSPRCLYRTPYRHPAPLVRKEHREESSATRQGWPGERTGLWTFRPESPRPFSPRAASDEIPEETRIKRRVPSNPKFLAPPPDFVELFDNRGAWLKPPPVKSAQGLAGKWTKWEEDSEGCWVQVGKNKDTDFEYTYYDREFRRELSTDSELPVPEGLTTDVKVFGLPAPNVEYWTVNSEHQLKSSRWVYFTRDPKRSDVGRVAEPPRAEQLPARAVEKTGEQVAAPGPVTEVTPLAATDDRPPPANDPPIVRSEDEASGMRVEEEGDKTLRTAEEILAFLSSIVKPQRVDDEDSPISLGSETSRAHSPMDLDPVPAIANEVPMTADELEVAGPVCLDPPYLRSTAFPLSTPLKVVEESVRAAARETPEVQILDVRGTSTTFRRTLWIAVATPEGAAVLRDTYPLPTTPPNARVSLLRATEEDFSQASLVAPPSHATGANKEPTPSTSGAPSRRDYEGQPGKIRRRSLTPYTRTRPELEHRRRGRSPYRSPNRRNDSQWNRSPPSRRSPSPRRDGSQWNHPPRPRRSPSPPRDAAYRREQSRSLERASSKSRGKRREVLPSLERRATPPRETPVAAVPPPTLAMDPALIVQLTSQTVLEVMARMGFVAGAPPFSAPVAGSASGPADAPVPPSQPVVRPTAFCQENTVSRTLGDRSARSVAGPSSRPVTRPSSRPVAGPSSRPLGERLTEPPRHQPLEARLSNPVSLIDRLGEEDLEEGEIGQRYFGRRLKRSRRPGKKWRDRENHRG